MAAVNRDQFLNPVALKIEEIWVPELGGVIYIKGMSAAGRAKFERQFELKSGSKNLRKIRELRERLIVAVVCDKDGAKLFTEADVEQIGQQPITMIERIVKKAEELCGFTIDSVDDMADAAKNSEETPDDS